MNTCVRPEVKHALKNYTTEVVSALCNLVWIYSLTTLFGYL